MLIVDNIHVNYDHFQALTGVSLEVHAGEIVALLGSNGVGKSTTINTISGLTKITSGDVIFNGESIKDIPAYKRVEMGIVQVPEGRRLFPSMTVRENLLVGSYLKGARVKRKETLEYCFEMFPKLAERQNQLAGSLSGGEQQMCAIARAFMSRPKLLMLDEPSLGLAPVIVDQIFKTIQRLNKDGMSILLVEQNVLASLEIAQRAYVIETGQNYISGTSEELQGNDEIRQSYLGM